MSLNLNTGPYYDNFDRTKKFSKILFKPGVPVQARELTQLQSILEQEHSEHLSHIFKEGAPILGAKGFIQKYPFIKVNDLDAASGSISNDVLINYVGDTLTGATSNLIAKVVSTETGSDGDAIDKKTFYLQYSQGDSTGTNLHFSAGETLTVTSADAGRNGDTFVVDNNTSTTNATANYFGKGLFFSIEAGLILINGRIVVHDQQTINLEKYKLNASYYVGVTLTDSIVTADDDSTLNDPAQGTFNYNAPGADRYKLSTTIAKLALTTNPSADFITMYTVENGAFSKTVDADVNFYAELGKTMAARTHEESGNYVIKNFDVKVREHLIAVGNNGYLSSADGGDANKIAVSVSSGVGYVNGFRKRIESPTYTPVPKGTDSIVEEGFTVPTSYGNYVTVNEVAGTWDIEEGTLVKFGNAAADAVTNATYGSTSAPSTVIGQGRVRQIVRSNNTPGTATTEYRLYLYDIRMTSSEFKSVRTIYFSNSTSSGFADPVLVGGDAILNEAKQNKLVFRNPFTSTKTLATDTGSTYDNNFFYQKEFDSTVASNGQVTLSVTGSTSFPYSSAITDSTVNDVILMVCKDAVTINGVAHSAGRVFKLTAAMFTAVSSTSLAIDLGTVDGQFDAKFYVIVKQTDVAPVPKDYRESRFVTINTTTHPEGALGPYNLGYTDVRKIEAVYVTASSGSYIEAGTNYKNEFILNDGQQDNLYGHAKLIKRQGSALSLTDKKITVKLAYFDPNYAATTATYFSYNSYPIDDTGASGIYTYEIPLFRSSKLGLYDLRDCHDFRPYAQATSTDATILSSASENPLETTDLRSPGGSGYTMPAPHQSLTTDAEYYLGRIDKIILSETGQVKRIKGEPSINPRSPQQSTEGMPLADIYIAPYPSVSPYVGRASGRKDLAVRVKNLQNKRYTMADIGQIENRINRLEYYTALSMLERGTQELTIPNANGVDRFKNGIFVNSFDSHALSNVLDQDYKCAIEPKLKSCQPFFFEENWDAVYSSVDSSLVTKTGNLVTLPYTTKSYKKVLVASKPRNCVGELLFNYKGTLAINPPSDNFTDIEDGGEVNILDNNLYDTVENLAQGLNNAKLVNQLDFGWQGEPESVPLSELSIPAPSINATGDSFAGSFSSSDSAFFGATSNLAGQGAGGDFLDGGRGGRRGRVNVNGTVGMTGNANVTTSGDYSGNINLAASSTGSTTFNVSGTTDGITVSSDVMTISTTKGEVIKNGEFGAVTDVTFQTYMRSQVVTFVGSRMKPNTRVYPFFNGDTVATHCRPASATAAAAINPDSYWSDFDSAVTGTFGDPILTDANGNVAGQFRIPAETFLVGERILRLVDDVSNRDDFVTTSCEQKYSAYGLTSTKSTAIFSTQIPDIHFGATAGQTETISGILTDVKLDGSSDVNISVDATAEFELNSTTSLEVEANLDGSILIDDDPIAQTFTISNREGVFVPKIDIYFKTKSATNGIEIQLREVINGYPGNKVVPYGQKVITPSEVNISSTDGSGNVTFNATTFTFDTPCYLKPNSEYCLVLLPQGNDPDYNVWVAELGSNKVGTTQRIVLDDINLGVLFTSSNNRTWNAYQAEDMMFEIHRCSFSTSNEGRVILKNDDIDWLKLQDFTAGVPAAGDALHGFDVTLAGGGSGYAVDEIITLNGGGGGTGAKIKVLTVNSGVVLTFELNDPGTGFTSNPGTLTQLSTTSSGSGASFALTLNRGIVENFAPLYSVARVKRTHGMIALNDLIGNGTSAMTISAIEDKVYNELRTNISFLDFPETEVEFEYSSTKSEGVSVPGTTYEVLIPGTRKKTTEPKSVYSYSNEAASLSGSKSFTARIDLNTSNNYLSPVLDLSRTSFLGKRNHINGDSTNETQNNGNALSRYISKNIILADGQEGEDLRVYLAQKMPLNTDIRVYGRFLAPQDDAIFNEDLSYTELELAEQPGIGTEEAFADFTYQIPDANKTSNVYTYDVTRVASATIGSGGSGYTTKPSVTFSGGGATKQATGYAVLSGAAVASIVITDPGRGYTGTPTITLTGGGGTGATATAVTGTVTYTGIKSFAVKVVFLSANSSLVPEIRELRAIALQA